MARSTSADEDDPELSGLYELVGVKIKSLREQMKITQEELANRSGVRRNYIVQIERLGLNLSIKLLFQLSEALGVEVSDLLLRDEPNKNAGVPMAVAREKLTVILGSTRQLAEAQQELLRLLGQAGSRTHKTPVRQTSSPEEPKGRNS